MAKRKSARKPPPKAAKEKLMSSFECLFCSHKGAVSVKLDKKSNTGYLGCKVCLQKFETPINILTEPIDVYSDWVDACEEANSKNPPVYEDYEDEVKSEREDDDDDDEEDYQERDTDHDALRALHRANKQKSTEQPKKKRRQRRDTPVDSEPEEDDSEEEEEERAPSSEEEEEAQASDDGRRRPRAQEQPQEDEDEEEEEEEVEEDTAPAPKRVKRTITNVDSDEE